MLQNSKYKLCRFTIHQDGENNNVITLRSIYTGKDDIKSVTPFMSEFFNGVNYFREIFIVKKVEK
jgi:hypothetical protein